MHFDDGGLFQLISPHGSKHWRLKYRFGGSEKPLALGPRPSVTLGEARELCDQAWLQLRESTDPADAVLPTGLAEGGMRWAEQNLDACVWRTPPARQQLRKRIRLSSRVADFMLPLPRQAVEVTRGLAAYPRGYSEFVFPSAPAIGLGPMELSP